MNAALQRLYARGSLELAEARETFAALVAGTLSEIEISALLIALKLKGETSAEIAGAADALRSAATPFPRPQGLFADAVGTGGDGANTFNISTAVTVVAAECGLPMVKHGNRSVSSRCGAADLLETFGIRLDMAPQTARHCLDSCGLTFLYAPHYHPGIRHAMPVRRQLSTRTLFNLLGPLVNPARPPVMLVGVYDPALAVTLAETLDMLGTRRALVVHGAGLDEIALHGRTQAVLLDAGRIEHLQLGPEDFGQRGYPLDTIVGGDPEHNAALMRALLSGRGSAAQRAIVAANSGALLWLAGRADDPRTGARMAEEVLAGERGLHRLHAFAAASRSPA